MCILWFSQHLIFDTLPFSLHTCIQSHGFKNNLLLINSTCIAPKPIYQTIGHLYLNVPKMFPIQPMKMFNHLSSINLLFQSLSLWTIIIDNIYSTFTLYLTLAISYASFLQPHKGDINITTILKMKKQMHFNSYR